MLVSIVAMSCETLIADCLRSLIRGSYQDFDIAVVENGGEAAFDRLAQTLVAEGLLTGDIDERKVEGRTIMAARTGASGARLLLILPETNVGYAGGNNIAIRQNVIRGWSAVWILNPDTIPEPDALMRLVERQRAGDFGVVGSRLVFTASGRIQTWGGLRWNLWLGRGRYLGYLQDADEKPDVKAVEQRTTFVSGASMYVTRRYIDDVGCMDESYFMFGEDLDWCLRRRDHGLGYAHDSVVRHIHGGTSGSSRHRSERSLFSIYFGERSKVLLARKFAGWGMPIIAAILLFLTLEHLLRARSWRQFSTALRGWLAGAKGETGLTGFPR